MFVFTSLKFFFFKLNSYIFCFELIFFFCFLSYLHVLKVKINFFKIITNVVTNIY
jgi:hypothetical protein